MSGSFPRSIRMWSLSAAVIAVTVVLLFLVNDAKSQQTTPERANVVMFMTDDLTATDLRHMPNVQKLLVKRGTTFENHTITLPTCCPSRVSYLRGQYPHNHEIGYGVTAGEQAFRNRGYGSSTVGTWANSEGYRTAWIGKYLNGFDDPGYVPPGWDRFYANVNSDVWSREFAADGKLRTVQKGNLDAHLGQMGEDFIRSGNEAPMLLVQNFNAPHQWQNGPPPAPKRDLRKFGAKIPRTPAFNEQNVSDKPGYIKKLRRLQPPQIRAIGIERKHRLASLQVVDRQVGAHVDALADKGELDETYIFFSTDNGYHMGEHRLEQGKMTPYRTDVEVPLVVRGPYVPQNVVRDEMVQNIDFAPTVADIAGREPPAFVDGKSILPLLQGKADAWRGYSHFEGRGKHPFVGVAKPDGMSYVRHRSGFEELYLPGDEHQLQNVAGMSEYATERSEMRVALEAAHGCQGASCP